MTARAYDHPALEGRAVVRLVPEGLGPAEDLAMELLRRRHFAAGADLLEALVAAGGQGERDSFGRLVRRDSGALASRWLAAGVYPRETADRLRGP